MEIWLILDPPSDFVNSFPIWSNLEDKIVGNQIWIVDNTICDGKSPMLTPPPPR